MEEYAVFWIFLRIILVCIPALKINCFFAHLDNNSFRNKFELLTKNTKGNIDILLISETNSDKSFHDYQFYIDAFSTTFWVEHNEKGGCH